MDKVRAEFEAWLPLPDGVKWHEKHAAYYAARGDVILTASAYHSQWRAWQAARQHERGEAVAWALVEPSGHVTAVHLDRGELARTYNVSADELTPLCPPSARYGEAAGCLNGGARYKVSCPENGGEAVIYLPRQMAGQWVALVDATDDKHMRAHPPAADARVAELEAQLDEMRSLSYARYEKASSLEVRIAALEAQLAERDAEISRRKEWQLAADAKLDASLEREGRMRDMLLDIYHANCDVPDAIGNDGQPYQSEYLASQLATLAAEKE